tara:strand:- start:36 stop:836 length:801 start_codon:yes stop_codon:yes gene_type:complete
MSLYNNITHDFFDTLNSYFVNPMVLFVLIIIIIIYYILFAFLGNSGNGENNSNGGSIFIEAILWGGFILLIFVNGLSYFYGINIITEFKNGLTEEPEIIIQTETDISNLVVDNNEVYHIPGNRFTYNDAKAVCKAMGSEMATYDQLNEANKKGASWCSYGWTKDQLGLYPTSQSDWKVLQKKEGHEYDCGLPGVNGGYVSNVYTKLGANCYGVKPKKSDLESEMLSDTLYPKTQKELLFDQRVKFWKNRVGNILLLPFNNENWNKL